MQPTAQPDPVEGAPRPGDEDDLILRIVPTTVADSKHPVYVPSQLIAEANALPSGSVESLISRKCAACHGPEMRNDMPLNVSANQWVYPFDDTALQNIIKDGIPEKGMPAAKDLSDTEISSLVSYLRAQSKHGKN